VTGILPGEKRVYISLHESLQLCYTTTLYFWV